MTTVQHILEESARRLVLLGRQATVHDAVRLLMNSETPLVVVCDEAGGAIGVISRTNVIGAFSRFREGAFATAAETIMSSPVLSFRPADQLQAVWLSLGMRGLRCAPVLDEANRPRGMLHARDIARALLDEVTNEEQLLRDYVLGVGYR